MRFVKLNAFQRVMRLWDAVHPYNAVQAFRLEGPADIDRLSDAWRATLREMGVGRTIVRGLEYAHVCPDDSDSRPHLQLPEIGTTLDELFTREMNVNMEAPDACPFRPFVLRETDGRSHVAGVTYHHWAADSYSMRWLLAEWFSHWRDPAYRCTKRARIPQEGLWRLFGPEASKWRVDEAILGLLRYRTRFCRARRVQRPMGDCGVEVSLHYLPDTVVPALVKLAKAHKVTVNDILLSAIAQTVDRLGGNPCTSGCDELALGTVVDLRALSPQTRLDDVFGLLLGFTTTVLRQCDLRHFPRMLRSVSTQNAWHKRSRAPQTSVLRMGVGLAEAMLYTPRRWSELYRDRMPIAASISNVNMTRYWAGAHHPRPLLDYYRVAPTGPMIPLMFTPTTLGTKMNFLITRQRDLIDDERNNQIAESLSGRLLALADPARGRI